MENPWVVIIYSSEDLPCPVLLIWVDGFTILVLNLEILVFFLSFFFLIFGVGF